MMIDLHAKSKESIALNWLRFPLAVLIVLIHTSATDNHTDFAFFLKSLLSEGIAAIAVPTFFFISGYLFFAKYEKFGIHEYLKMLKKKSKSLLLPYLLWIAICYYGMGLIKGFGSNPFDFYKIFWAASDGYVATSLFGYKFSILSAPSGCGVLWFVRDLMVVMAISPIFWVICKRLKMYSVILFIVPYIFNIGIPIQGFGLAALCFFPLGAAYSINGSDIFKFVRKYGILFGVIFVITIAVRIIFISYNSISIPYLQKFICLSGTFTALWISYTIVSKDIKQIELICKLGDASFFIYVGQALPIFILMHHITDRVEIIPYIGNTLAYIISFILKLVLVTTTYFILEKYMPTLLSVLVGGRIKSKNDKQIST